MKAAIMRTLTVFLVCYVILAYTNCIWAQEIIPQLNREKLPGRQVKVAAICIGFDGEHDVKLKLALEHLHTAGKNGVDIACLPEEFAGTEAEPIPGPTTKAVARLARKYNMYVIFPGQPPKPWQDLPGSTICMLSVRYESRRPMSNTIRLF